MVFDATFNNILAISWWSVLLVEETGVPGENHPPAASHWQTLSHNAVSSIPAWAGFKLTTLLVTGADCISSKKPNYHIITTTTAPGKKIYNSIIKITFISTKIPVNYDWWFPTKMTDLVKLRLLHRLIKQFNKSNI